MAPTLVRGIACLRAPMIANTSAAAFTPRSLPYILQTASVSYRPNPLAPRRPNQPPPAKIPQSARPLARTGLEPPTITAEELAKRPYVVRRTPFAQLPIYRKWKSGGTQLLVLIKKVNGDKLQLVSELREKLNIEAERIRINPTTTHIEIKVCFLTWVMPRHLNIQHIWEYES